MLDRQGFGARLRKKMLTAKGLTFVAACLVGSVWVPACGTSGQAPGGGGSSGSGSSSGSSSGGGGSSGGGSGSSSGGSSSGTLPDAGNGCIGCTVEAGAPDANSVEVYQTSRNAGEGGAPEHMKDEGPVAVSTTLPDAGATTVTVDTTTTNQTIIGFGAAITEATATVVSSLPAAQQQEIVNAYWGTGPQSSGYTIARTHIGSCDFALTQYSFDDTCGGPSTSARPPCTTADPTLAQFSIAHDTTVTPGVPGSGVLVPFLKSAIAASGGVLRVLGSPWSAPGWMKSNGQMQGTGGDDGTLMPMYYGAYAEYLSKYIQAYKAAGVPIWAITPQNEALGVGASRESMAWTPQTMDTWIGTSMGPTFMNDGVNPLVFIYDHNKGPVNSDMQTWASLIYGDSVASPFVAGEAVHWYGSTYETYTDTLDAVHAIDPTKMILYNEAVADELGNSEFGVSTPNTSQTQQPTACAAPNSGTPTGGSTSAASSCFQYTWMSDDFYWIKDDWDWGWWYSTQSDHPVYEPVYRYARDIITGLNHWYNGFQDWNAVLNMDGNPGHIFNPVPAGILIGGCHSAAISTNSPSYGQCQGAGPFTIYYTPTYYALQHFSKFFRPGASVLPTTVSLASSVSATDYDGTPTQDGAALLAASARNTDNSIVVVLFNETNAAIDYTVDFGTNTVTNSIPSQALQTIVWQ
jgi:glucosylceramidase